MRSITIITPILCLFMTFHVWGQSKTTKIFAEKHQNAFTLFFYNNTLKMLNQNNNKEFETLVKDIDKMKFIRVDKTEDKFTNDDFKSMVADYHADNFDDLMTMRHEGMNINVFIQEDGGVTTGVVLLMNEAESFSVLDIVGKVPIDQLGHLISRIQEVK